MKLLGWMPCKFRLSEPLKDCVIGKPTLDDQQPYTNSYRGFKYLDKKQRDYHLQRPFSSTEAAIIEVEKDIEEKSFDHFHGFLAIGTLGLDALNTDPPTPTLAITIQNIPEKVTQLTENEMKIINEEMENVLGGEGNDKGSHDATGRNRHNSTSRSSQASTTELGGKQTDATDSKSSTRAPICPLEGYSLGTAVEFLETMLVKKERRTSLGELLQTTRIAEGDHVAKCKRGEMKKEKKTDKQVTHLMEKMLKKKKNHASCWSSNKQTGGNESASKEKRLYKILNMFHKKVHPEDTTALAKSDEPHKCDIRDKTTCERRNHRGDQMHLEEYIMKFPKKSASGDGLRNLKNPSNPPQVSNGNREYWVKTDADYLVLEL